jgi:hypothetical protein
LHSVGLGRVSVPSQIRNNVVLRIDQKAIKIFPKVARLTLRLAFLAPSIIQAIIEDQQAEEISLSTIPNKLPIKWTNQVDALGRRYR